MVPLGLADGYGSITGPSPPDNIRFGREGMSNGGNYILTVPKQKVLTGVKVKGKRGVVNKLSRVLLRVKTYDLFNLGETHWNHENLRLPHEYV